MSDKDKCGFAVHIGDGMFGQCPNDAVGSANIGISSEAWYRACEEHIAEFDATKIKRD